MCDGSSTGAEHPRICTSFQKRREPFLLKGGRDKERATALAIGEIDIRAARDQELRTGDTLQLASASSEDACPAPE